MEPDWPRLPADTRRQILLSARGGLRSIMERDLARGTTLQQRAHRDGWATWWQLVARCGSTCRALREALLGPESLELWQWAYYESPELWVGRTARQAHGLHGLMLRQVHFAQAALVRGNSWQGGLLQTSLAGLTAVQHLTLWDFWCLADVCAALGSQPDVNTFIWDTAVLARLQALVLDILYLPIRQDLRLDTCLWPLPHLRLHLADPISSLAQAGDKDVCKLQMLDLPPGNELRLHLDMRGAAERCLTQGLSQLARVQLSVLELTSHQCCLSGEQLLLLLRAGSGMSWFCTSSRVQGSTGRRTLRACPPGLLWCMRGGPDSCA